MRPRVILHNQVSVDGRITGFPVDMALHYGATAGFGVDAHLAGSDTLLAIPEDIPPDDGTPIPEASGDDGRPLLVVPDSRGRVRIWHFLGRQPFWRKMVSLCTEQTPADHLAYLRERNVDRIVTGAVQVDLPEALAALQARYGVQTVLCDSGGTLNGVLLCAGLVDEISLLVSPHLVGGDDHGSLVRGPTLPGDPAERRLELYAVDKAGENHVWLRYRLHK